LSAPVFDYRASRGAEIAAVESNIRRISKDEYRVKSQHGNGEYQVISGELGWLCNCPDAMYRGVKCKHQFAVELSLQIRRRIENARRVVPLDYQSCLSCGSAHIKRDGILHNKSGPIQRFECLECGKRFTNNLGFERMRASPQAITTAMQMYFGGESLRNVQKSLRLQGVNVNHTTIYRWIQKYVGLMEEYLNDFTPQVSGTWRADELFVKVKGQMKYLFSMMDDETRFWIAQQVSSHKEGANASRLFRDAKTNAGMEPTTLITDGLRTYSEASAFDFPHTNHIREIQLGGIVHNNKMERMNGEVRDREKTMRGLKTANSPIIKGWQIYHNFIRPHEALGGATPAERAGIVVEGPDKWATIIQNAQHQRRNREDCQHQ
jgi:transposase-like protein